MACTPLSTTDTLPSSTRVELIHLQKKVSPLACSSNTSKYSTTDTKEKSLGLLEQELQPTHPFMRIVSSVKINMANSQMQRKQAHGYNPPSPKQNKSAFHFRKSPEILKTPGGTEHDHIPPKTSFHVNTKKRTHIFPFGVSLQAYLWVE